MRAERCAALAAVAALIAGCDGCGQKPPAASTGAMAALQAPSATMVLPVAGFGDAVVDVPVGATRAMPVVVAVLGIGDTPEEQCDTWRDVVGTRAFVLCTRGAKHWVVDEEDAGAPAPEPAKKESPPPEESASAEPSDASPPPPPKAVVEAGVHQVGFFPVDVPTLDKELAAALTALKSRFQAYVDDKSLVYAGFSRGAFLGASLVARHPDKFGHAILIEGGQSAWTPESAAQFAQRGGKRVLFACGQPSCVDESEPAAQLLRQQKLDIRVVHGSGEGHGYKKQVKDELKKNFEWVVEGEAAWATKP